MIAQVRPLRLEQGLVTAVKRKLDAQLQHLTLPEETALGLYRALQACLDNILRHAWARTVVVTLAMTGGQLTLRVADDGIGFDVARPVGPRAYGLLGMTLRMAALGGAMAVASSPGAGAAVTLSVPLHRGTRPV